MASGKPVLMYKLDGIPDEYDDYLYYIKGNSVNALKNSILDICNKSSNELYEFGKRAKQFVLNMKNNVMQAQKILKLIKKV